MSVTYPLSVDAVRRSIDAALSSLAACAVLASDAESLLDLRLTRSALTYYRWQRLREDAPATPHPTGSLTVLVRTAEASISNLLEDSANTAVQASVLRVCLLRVRAVAVRRIARAASGVSWGLGSSLPAGDRAELPVEEGGHELRA